MSGGGPIRKSFTTFRSVLDGSDFIRKSVWRGERGERRGEGEIPKASICLQVGKVFPCPLSILHSFRSRALLCV